MQIFKDTHFDFQGKRRLAYIFSGSLILIGIISLILHGGPKYSIDFLGGMSLRLQFSNPASEGEVRNALSHLNLGSSEVKTIHEMGEKPEILIRIKQSESGEDTQQLLISSLREQFSSNPFDVRSVDRVGPRIGTELRNAAILAILVTLVLILIYLSWRFEFKFGVGAVVALFHDVMITLGAFSLLNMEISLAVVAAFLTIVGYSLNDTIVIFDRIRENLKKHSTMQLKDIINISVNETLSRTFITAGTTFIVVLSLFIFGGQVIHEFSFALLMGIIFGTYSSIYIASPVLLEWRTQELLRKKRQRGK